MQFTDLGQTWLILAIFAPMSAASLGTVGKAAKGWLVSDGLSWIDWKDRGLSPQGLLSSSRLVWTCSQAVAGF